MSVNLSTCKWKISDQYIKDPSSANNISSMMTRAWGSDRSDCRSAFGWTSQVRDYVKTLKNSSYHPSSDKDKSESTIYQRQSQAESSSSDSSFLDWIKVIWSKWVWIIWTFVLCFVFWILFKYLFEFLYDVMNSKRMIFLKITQTREDSKWDREVQKELAKDMKEKIWRMTQVYNNLHKLGQLGVVDNILRWMFNKPKIILIYSYEDWQLSFVVGLYPEYRSVFEGALSAQYSSSSMEIIPKPNFFAKKYSDIALLEPEKEEVYPIKTFKNLPDDPINNIIDSLGKISQYDTAHIVMPSKPMWSKYNRRARLLVDAEYRKDKSVLIKNWRLKRINPIFWIRFFLYGPDKDMIATNDDGTTWDKMVRMVKAQEDALNAMWEEAALPAFMSSIMVVTSSDERWNLDSNIDTMMTAYNIFNDEYCNKLTEPQIKWDIFWFIFKPIWKFAVSIWMPYFFCKKSVFFLNSLASLWHLPDGMYNRSPIISWMDYKALPAPENLPTMKNENWFIISGMLAEKYKWWKLSDILQWEKHRAVWSKDVSEDILEPVEKYTSKELEWKEIIDKDGQKFVKMPKSKKVRWYKCYKDWVLLGVNIYRNKYSPVYFGREDRTRHHYSIGKSGTGKSVFIQSIARQDIRNGDGICVIDPHGDLAEDMLEYIPKEKAKDVIFFDAGNEDRPIWLNLYDIDNIDQADRTVNDATEIFIKMFWSEIFWPRIQEYFKYGSLTLLEDFEDKPTLLDVPRLFTDETYRDFKTKKVKNAVVKNFRDKTYNAMWDREKQEIIPYFTSKFVSFNTNRLIRNIIWQTKTWIKFREAMDNQKVILISLSKGKIWEINAQLLGMIIVSQIYNSAMGRANMEAKDRKDFYLYVDEFQNFVSWTFADILSEARKYRLSLFMAHQYIAQLESEWWKWWWKADVKAAVFWNCGTLMSFKVGAPDAEFLEKEYAPILGQQDIVGISNYKAYIKLNINNSTTRVFSMNAIYTKDYQNKKIASILKEYSAKKYGRKREFVDAEITARLGLGSDTDAKEEPKQEPK